MPLRLAKNHQAQSPVFSLLPLCTSPFLVGLPVRPFAACCPPNEPHQWWRAESTSASADPPRSPKGHRVKAQIPRHPLHVLFGAGHSAEENSEPLGSTQWPKVIDAYAGTTGWPDSPRPGG
jgi:hypothetical protein